MVKLTNLAGEVCSAGHPHRHVHVVPVPVELPGGERVAEVAIVILRVALLRLPLIAQVPQVQREALAYSEKECFAGCSYFGLQRERILCGLLNAHTLAYSGKEIYAGCSYFGLQREGKNFYAGCSYILWPTAETNFMRFAHTLDNSGKEFYPGCSYFDLQQKGRILCGLLIMFSVLCGQG